jgi:hypothetical protein
MHRCQDNAKCLGMDTNLFFDKYEEEPDIAKSVDLLCRRCPVNQDCFAWGISQKEWGVWGGIYLKDGKIDREFNAHKSRGDWSDTWESLTMERE